MPCSSDAGDGRLPRREARVVLLRRWCGAKLAVAERTCCVEPAADRKGSSNSTASLVALFSRLKTPPHREKVPTRILVPHRPRQQLYPSYQRTS